MKVLSNWRAVRLWESELERQLHQRHWLRLHGWAIGSLMLLLMWGVATLQKALGVQSMALRYLLTLGVAYGAYLLVLRLWAQWLVRRDAPNDPGVDGSGGGGCDPAHGSSGALDGAAQAQKVAPVHSGGGGDFAGGGASVNWDVAQPLSNASDAGSDGLTELASGALDAAGSADEGAIVIVPVMAVFVAGVGIVFGAGSLLLMYFGIDALLAVAVEVAFSYTAARTAVSVSREGWLSAAVRLSWKPLLGALACALVLGASIDHFMPQAQSLPEALRILRGP